MAGPPFPSVSSGHLIRCKGQGHRQTQGQDDLNRVCGDVSQGGGERGGGAREEVKLDAAQEQSFDPWPDWQRLVSANQPASMSEKITFPTINSH